MAEEGGEMEDQGDPRVKSREESIILKTMITEEAGITMIMDMMADTEIVATMMNSTTMMTLTITDHYHMTDQEEQDLCTGLEVCPRESFPPMNQTTTHSTAQTQDIIQITLAG